MYFLVNKLNEVVIAGPYLLAWLSDLCSFLTTLLVRLSRSPPILTLLLLPDVRLCPAAATAPAAAAAAPAAAGPAVPVLATSTCRTRRASRSSRSSRSSLSRHPDVSQQFGISGSFSDGSLPEFSARPGSFWPPPEPPSARNSRPLASPPACSFSSNGLFFLLCSFFFLFYLDIR